LFEAPSVDDPRKAANEGLRRLQARKLEPRLRQIELEIAAKQTDVDPAALSLLWKERSEFQRLLRQPPVLPAVG
jgi:DNA primase